MSTMLNKVKQLLVGKPSESYFVYVIAGMVIMMLGLTAMTGGGIGIQATADSEVRLIQLNSSGTLPEWICWLLVWIGLDYMIFRGRLTGFVLGKVVNRDIIGKVWYSIRGEELKILKVKDEGGCNEESDARD